MARIPQEVLGAFDLVPDVPSVPQGGTSGYEVWRVESGGRRYALRLGPAWAARPMHGEVAAAEAARRGGIPTPEIVGVRSSEDWAAMLTVWCPGTPVARTLVAGDVDPLALGRACGAVQAHLHAIDAPSELSDRTDWATPTAEEKQILARASASRAKALVHFDLHPGNILTEGPTVVGVIDWENAAAGDPRQDLARSLSVVGLVMTLTRTGSPGLSPRLDAFSHAWLRGYEEILGPVADLPVFLAWAARRTIRDLSGKWPPEEVSRMEEASDAWIATLAGDRTAPPGQASQAASSLPPAPTRARTRGERRQPGNPGPPAHGTGGAYTRRA